MFGRVFNHLRDVLGGIDLFLIFLSFLVLLIVVFALVSPVVRSGDLSECLKRGYSQAYSVYDDGERIVYCSRIQDGSEKVVRLELDGE